MKILENIQVRFLNIILVIMDAAARNNFFSRKSTPIVFLYLTCCIASASAGRCHWLVAGSAVQTGLGGVPRYGTWAFFYKNPVFTTQHCFYYNKVLDWCGKILDHPSMSEKQQQPFRPNYEKYALLIFDDSEGSLDDYHPILDFDVGEN